MQIFKYLTCPECKYRKEVPTESRQATCPKCGHAATYSQKWYIRYQAHGKVNKRAISTKKSDAELALKAAKDGKEYVRLTRKKPILFGQAADQYLEHCKHQAGYENKVHHLKHFKALWERKPLYEISIEAIKNEHNRLSHEKSPSTANRYLATLKNLYTHAENVEWIDYTVLHQIRKIERFDEPEEGGRALKLEEYPRLIAAANESPCEDLTDIINFGLFTGFRESNILGCRINQHLDMDHRFFRFPKSEMKGKRTQITAMIPEVYDLIANRLRNRPGDITHDYLFFNKYDTKKHKRGEPYTRHQIRHFLEKALEKAGIEDFSIHCTKHSTVTALSLTGTNDLTIQKIAQHADLKTTQKYTHMGLDVQRDALSKAAQMYLTVLENKGPDNPPNLKLVGGGER